MSRDRVEHERRMERRALPGIRRRSARTAILGSLLALAAGCAATKATTSAKPAGFLGDYSSLKPGGENEAQFVYIDPAAKFERYDSVMLESVTFWVTDASHAESLDARTRQSLTDRLYRVLFDRLACEYKMVDRPGPTVMVIRAAITEAKDARVVLNAITTILPVTRLLAQFGDLHDDTAVLIGKAAVECEILDSTTKTRLAAAVDERMGNKTLETAFTKWGDVDAAIEFWVARLGDRLGKLRKGDRTPVEG